MARDVRPSVRVPWRVAGLPWTSANLLGSPNRRARLFAHRDRVFWLVNFYPPKAWGTGKGAGFTQTIP